MVPRPRVLLLALALLAACGGSSDSGGGGGGEVSLPAGVWTWVDVPGSICSEGSQTGVAVNPGTSGMVLVFLDGGGACWDTLTCFTADLAKPGPYGKAQWDAETRLPGSLLDRTVPGNPFADATLVFVPYCTGDNHWGNATNNYPQAPRAWHHHGAPNLQGDVQWLAQHLPAPTKVVVGGSSAGGFGSWLAFDLARKSWPSAKGYLVDDSGPPLVGNDIHPEERAAWFAAWRLDQTLLPLCGQACVTDVSAIVSTIATRYPADRLSLLSSRQDQVISAFFILTPGDFEAALLQLVDERFTPTSTARAFLVTGTDHALLRQPAAYTSGQVPLTEWLRRQVQDDPAWDTVGR